MINLGQIRVKHKRALIIKAAIFNWGIHLQPRSSQGLLDTVMQCVWQCSNSLAFRWKKNHHSSDLRRRKITGIMVLARWISQADDWFSPMGLSSKASSFMAVLYQKHRESPPCRPYSTQPLIFPWHDLRHVTQWCCGPDRLGGNQMAQVCSANSW